MYKELNYLDILTISGRQDCFFFVWTEFQSCCFVPLCIIGQMYSLDPGVEPQMYTYNVPEEIRRFIHFFHQHVTEQVSTIYC